MFLVTPILCASLTACVGDLQRLASLERPAFPLHGVIARIMNRAGAAMLTGWIGEDDRCADTEEQRYGESSISEQPRHRTVDYPNTIATLNSRRLFRKVVQQGRSE